MQVQAIPIIGAQVASIQKRLHLIADEVVDALAPRCERICRAFVQVDQPHDVIERDLGAGLGATPIVRTAVREHGI